MDACEHMLFKLVMPFVGRAAPAFVGAVLLVGCGGASAPAQRAAAAPLPQYTERDALLFDDGVEDSALGFSISSSGDRNDKLMADRIDACDGVVRARVTTVTSKTEDSGHTLQISLHAVETLAGKRAPEGDFTLLASPRSPAAGMLRASEGRLVGLTFIAFVRGFASPEPNEGDGVLHYHLARDDKDEQDKVRAASLGPR
jgi:hypothetical protein